MPFPVAAFSVFFGTVSHLVLDAWMHADMNVAFLSVMPTLPDMDHPGEAIAFSEFVAALAFVVALLIWPCRLALVALFTKAYQFVRKERIPSLSRAPPSPVGAGAGWLQHKPLASSSCAWQASPFASSSATTRKLSTLRSTGRKRPANPACCFAQAQTAGCQRCGSNSPILL